MECCWGVRPWGWWWSPCSAPRPRILPCFLLGRGESIVFLEGRGHGGGSLGWEMCSPRCSFPLCHAQTGLAGSDGHTGTPVHTVPSAFSPPRAPETVWGVFANSLPPLLSSHDETPRFGSGEAVPCCPSPRWAACRAGG